MKSKLVLLIAIIFIANCSNIQEVNATITVEASSNQALEESTIDSLMNVTFDRGLFNGNVLVAKNNEIIYQREFGYVDGAKSKKITQNSIFNIGSIAKEFNAVAIMLLKEKELLDLDDKISKFELGLPEWADSISIKHLLKYTSGLPRIDWSSVKNDQDVFNNLKILKQLEFEPGSDYIYSNNNIFLQKKIVEKVAGMDFNSFIQKNILTKVGMKNSVIDPKPDHPELVIAFNNDYINDELMDIEFSGWVNPTINDLYQWTNYLHSGKLITKESVMTLFDAYSPGSASALGIGMIKNDQLQAFQHHGSHFNFESFIYKNVSEGLTIILMTNNKNFKLQEIALSIESITKGNPFSLPQKSVYLTIKQKCYDDVNAGIQYYKDLKKDQPDLYSFSDENELNHLGYKLLEKEKIEDAIQIFKLLVSEFPNSANPYDSLGEAYYLNGNKDLAILNYKKSLELNPDNSNAEAMIKKIENQ